MFNFQSNANYKISVHQQEITPAHADKQLENFTNNRFSSRNEIITIATHIPLT